jgi:CheY-like chemotaxis protein
MKKLKTILVVEDTPDLLHNLTEFLVQEGYHVLTSSTGSDALAQLQQRETPDLIITDLSMPGIDGLILIEEIKKDVRFNKIPIVIFTARPKQDYEENARTLGVTISIKKPALLEEILSTISPLLV